MQLWSLKFNTNQNHLFSNLFGFVRKLLNIKKAHSVWAATRDRQKYSRNCNNVQLIIIIDNNDDINDSNGNSNSSRNNNTNIVIVIVIIIISQFTSVYCKAFCCVSFKLLPLFLKFYSSDTKRFIRPYPPGKIETLAV